MSTTTREPGFAATLHGANLFDLIQMECLARVHRVMRVTSGHNVGYLYLRDGQVVHALTPDLVGERAALEILRWNDGTFEPCQLRFPPRDSIECGFQDLLMRAAQERDESSRSNLVEFPQTLRAPAKAPSFPPPAASRTQAQGNRAHRAVRLSADGNVIAEHAADDDFIGMAAYSIRLGDLVGEALGMTALAGIEAQFTGGHCAVWVSPEGEVSAVHAASEAEVEELALSWRPPGAP